MGRHRLTQLPPEARIIDLGTHGVCLLTAPDPFYPWRPDRQAVWLECWQALGLPPLPPLLERGTGVRTEVGGTPRLRHAFASGAIDHLKSWRRGRQRTF